MGRGTYIVKNLCMFCSFRFYFADFATQNTFQRENQIRIFECRCFAHLYTDITMIDNQVCEEDADDDIREEFGSALEVDDIDEPLPTLSLREARDYARRLMEFVTINQEFIKRDGSSSSRDYSNDLDALIQALACVSTRDD